MRHVVVGLHAAGRSACAWLRRASPAAEIIGIDPSALPVYSRPLISYALSGEMAPAAMTVADDAYYDSLGVKLIPERAVALDPARGSLTLSSGEELAYDRLLLACGASPRPAGVEGPLRDEVCYFRGRADLSRIMERVCSGGVAAVLGGGLVGFKLTMGLLAQGMSVQLIVASPRPLALNVDEYVGRWVGDRLSAMPGVTLRTSTSVSEVHPGKARALRLDLTTGESLEVDLVAAGKGVVPALDWLSGSGLPIEAGLLADLHLRTADERIYAAGDVAQVPDVVHGDARINAVWPVAVEQGRVAALNMAGADSPSFGTLAQNAIPVFGSRMISVGAVNPAVTGDCVAEEAMCSDAGYLKLVFREDRLIGAVGLDAPPRLGELAHAIRRGLRRSDVPRFWLDNPKNAAPLSATGGATARNAWLH